MNWLEQIWHDAGEWITRATELAPERDPTKWDWNLNKEVDWNVGHSPIASQSIIPALELQTFGALPVIFYGSGSYLAPMRAQWVDEKYRAWYGAPKSELVNFDPRASSTYTDTAVPTSQAAANISIAALITYFTTQEWTIPFVMGGMVVGEDYIDRQLGIPEPKTDYGKKAQIISAIIGTLIGAYGATQNDGLKTGTTPKADTSTADALKALMASLSGGGAGAPATVKPKSSADISAPHALDTNQAYMLAGVGLLGFVALNKT